MSIRIGILGYGNLGRGVEAAIAHNPDMELVGVFTRRDPASVKIATAGVSVYHTDDAEKMQDQIDQWMDEAQVERSETLESLDLQAFYDGLTTLRSDISAASQADSAPAETTTPTETAAPTETPAA